MIDRTNEPKKSRIPEFKTYKEEAEFWDTHDFTEFEDETRPVQVEVSPNLTSIYSIRVDEDTSQKLYSLARKKGIGPTTLGRMLIIEGLDRLEHARI